MGAKSRAERGDRAGSYAVTCIALGPFDLRHIIGSGGMGQVWRADHRASGSPVAIKVLTHEQAHKDRFQIRFKNEVRAVASLNHAHIVRIIDYGSIPEISASRQNGLIHGAPYFAMELAQGETADGMVVGAPWAAMRDLLLQMLAALGHAHARGIIHLDLKPANCLQFEKSGDQTVWKLVDFGIAHVLSSEQSATTEGGFVGTPFYMAPEQVEGAFRDVGPWTDLYAIGCVAWQLVTGQPPFVGKQPVEIGQAHIHKTPPRLMAAIPTPRNLESFLLCLLSKNPAERFQRASDAAQALTALGDVETELKQLAHNQPRSLAAATLAQTMKVMRTRAATEGRPYNNLQCRGGPPWPPGVRITKGLSNVRTKRRPPGEGAEHTTHLRIGLGLFGLRTFPIVGRKTEREALWAGFEDVCQNRKTRLAVLRGPAGVGKSRLAQWLSHRAHELGGATLLRATHNPIAGPADGLARMVSVYLRCVGLAQGELLNRTRKLLRREGLTDPYEWEALSQLQFPLADPPWVRFSSPIERYALIGRMLRRVGTPCVVWLDDVHWGTDSLDFAHELLRQNDGEAAPVLLILTARDEALAERSVERAKLDEIEKKTNEPIILRLESLKPTQQRELVRSFLGLDPSLSARVEERAAGNPLFALQLVTDWAGRGLLEASDLGYRLKVGANPSLPDDVYGVWTSRIIRFLDKRPTDDTLALELAAALGQQFDTAEWNQLCLKTGVTASHDLVDALHRGCYLEASSDAETGFSFIHGMLRESIARRATEAGRWKAHNRALAAMLKQRGTTESARLGRILVEAEDFEKSLEPLLEGARAFKKMGDLSRTLAILDELDQVMRRIDVPDADPKWGECWLLRAEIHTIQTELDEAAAIAERALEAAQRHTWNTIRGAALSVQAKVAERRRDLTLCRNKYTAALKAYQECGDPVGTAMAQLGLGTASYLLGDTGQSAALFQEVVLTLEKLNANSELADALVYIGYAHWRRGKFDDAIACMDRALKAYRKMGSRHGDAVCHYAIGLVETNRGKPAKALEAFRIARRRYDELGDRLGVVDALNGIANTARGLGDLDTAEQGYRDALQLGQALWESANIAPTANLGVVLLMRGRFEDAKVFLERALNLSENAQLKGLEGAIHALLLPCHVGDQQGFSQHHQVASTLLAQTEYVDPDLAWALDQAGQLADTGGHTSQAKRAWLLALDQCRALEDERLTKKIQNALENLKNSESTE